MNLAHTLLPRLSVNDVSQLDRESAIFAFQHGSQLAAVVLVDLALRFPEEALTHARDLFDSILLTDLANLVPSFAIQAKLGAYLTSREMANTLLQDPRLLSALDGELVKMLPASLLLDLFALDPIHVLACAAAVHRLPRSELGKVAREALAYERDATPYPLRFWSTACLEPRRDVHTLFHVARSQVGQGFSRPLTDAETNLYTAGLLCCNARVRTIRYRMEGVSAELGEEFAAKCALYWGYAYQYSAYVGVLSDGVRRTDDCRSGSFYVAAPKRFGLPAFFDLKHDTHFCVEARVAPDAPVLPAGARLRVTLDCEELDVNP